jgi:hypothetical protein
MTKKLVTYGIEYCNNRCPHFYHNYEDMENAWCSKLAKKIFGCDTVFTFGDDFEEREIPKECPLKDAL